MPSQAALIQTKVNCEQQAMQDYIKIGEYRIKVIGGTVYIYKQDGEGGGFDKDKVEKCIAKFFEENF